jgi:RNA polymerase sigma factor (sigma-70 family)
LIDDDYDLISRCLNREEAAEKQLYIRFSSKMFGICRRYAGNETEAKDILQNGFLRVFSRLHQFRYEGSFDGWVQRIFVRTAINYYHQNLKFRHKVELTEKLEEILVPETTLANMSANELLAIIHSLPDDYRIIFNMYVIEDYDHNEIARLMGIQEGTSKSLLHRAKSLVRKRLEEIEKEETSSILIVMEEKDPLETRFKSAFSGFEHEPPAESWDNLHAALHPLTQPAGFWSRITNISALLHLHPAFYVAFSGAAFLTFLTVGYFVLTGHHTIRGHAYAGAVRLDGGSAGLFKVADKTLPWDSVSHYRSAIIDHSGHFQFSQVREGNYLLRVAPDEDSEAASGYEASWFDSRETSDSSEVIVVKGGDVNLEVRLVRSSGVTR